MAGSQGRDNWAAMHRAFGWRVPADFNIAQACCGRWAGRADAHERVAIIAHGQEPAGTLTFAQLQCEANAMSNLLAGLGVGRGDRVAIVMPQRFETAIAYMAVLQLGAVAMPLSMLFGPEALEYRLQDSEAVVAICDDGVLHHHHSSAESFATVEEAVRGMEETVVTDRKSTRLNSSHHLTSRMPSSA